MENQGEGNSGSVSVKCGQVGTTKNLNRAMHDCILRPPAVLTDTVECQEEIPDITNQLY